MTLSHTQTTTVSAHWRISLEYGNWCVDRTHPLYSGVATWGSYYTLGTATQVVQDNAAVGDTVEVSAPDDGANGYTGTVTDCHGNLLVSWREVTA